mmetsp:Transcript_2175/g.5384  ORF Transcript_2175/g.5384 Transcript_2175/m.5384 type:complete len:110 (-) Transcript_2175:73-402(-)
MVPSAHASKSHSHHKVQRPHVAALVHLFCKLRYLGLLGYAIEWLLEATHVSRRMHRWFHRLTSPRVHLLAISCVLAGHFAEHLHQEEENHAQEERIAALEAQLSSKKVD